MDAHHCISGKRWWLPFSAVPEEVGGLRRLVRTHLDYWNLPHLTDTAQLCVSELASNVIKHVGVGTPAELVVEVRETTLRIEVLDPGTGTVPAQDDAVGHQTDEWEREDGRGFQIIGVLAVRCGLDDLPKGRVAWAELDIGAADAVGAVNGAGGGRVDTAEALLMLYQRCSGAAAVSSRLGRTVGEQSVIDLVTDLLHWVRAHGCDPDEVLDRAVMRFEAGMGTGAA